MKNTRRRQRITSKNAQVVNVIVQSLLLATDSENMLRLTHKTGTNGNLTMFKIDFLEECVYIDDSHNTNICDQLE